MEAIVQALLSIVSILKGFQSGMIVATGSTAAPTGWLLCDGSAVSRTTYANLFAAIGTAYGSGDGSTTFNLPDLRGRVVVGVDSAGTRLPDNSLIGQSGGEAKHSLTSAENGPHTHTANNQSTTQFIVPSGSAYGLITSNTSTTGSSGSGTAHENRQPYQIANHIIKI